MPGFTWFCSNCGDGPWNSEVMTLCTSCNIGQCSSDAIEFANASYRGSSTHDHSTHTGFATCPTATGHSTHTGFTTCPTTHGPKTHIWNCCQCGGQNSYELNPGCTNYGQRGYCGHWVEGCAYCVVQEVRPRKG